MLSIFALLTFFVASTSAKLKAVVVLSGPGGVRGNVTFVEQGDKTVTVEGIIEGLEPGNHGFHIHAKGDLTNGCSSTGSHFNPFHNSHGGPKDEYRHVGDLGNVLADSNGIARVAITDSVISFQGEKNIIGRGLVVHANADDLGKGGHNDSLSTGHAGSRVACGIINVDKSGVTTLSFSLVPLTLILVSLSNVLL